MRTGKVKGVELLRSGVSIKDNAGKEVRFTDADLDGIVANLPNYPASMVLGHTVKPETPAVGWPERLYRVKDKLLGDLKDIPASIADKINGKQFKKISLALAKDLNGKAGWTMRHIGLLGANPPAVPGLSDIPVVEFAADVENSLTVTFDKEIAVERNAAIEILKAAKVSEVCFAEAIPDAVVVALAEREQAHAVELAKAAPKSEEPKPAAAPKDSEVEQALKLLAAGKAEARATLLAQRKARASEALTLAVKEGRMTPAERPAQEAILASVIEDLDETVELAAGQPKVTAFDALVKGIASRPVMAIFGEVSPEALKTEADSKKAKVELAARKLYQTELAETPGCWGDMSEDQFVTRRLQAEKLVEIKTT